jgi:hypothetical protein
LGDQAADVFSVPPWFSAFRNFRIVNCKLPIKST